MAIDPGLLTMEHKLKALRAVKLIKQKRNFIIKGRMCVNDAPHRTFLSREEARSGTILEALISSMMIYAFEG